VLSGLKGRDVIDVGASVGDTALYFILNGARKVIAVEPLPNVVRCAWIAPAMPTVSLIARRCPLQEGARVERAEEAQRDTADH
jgi:FkbM family methyltransferase